MKKILLCCAVSLIVSSTLFAQLTLTSPAAVATGIEASARSRATADTMLSDSDKITADKIHEIDQTFFSGGFTREEVLSGYWAMPLGNNMIVGFAGEYNMASKRTEDYDDTTNPGTVDFTKEILEESSFDLRAAFGFSNMAATYQITRDIKPNTITETKTYSAGGILSKEVYNNLSGEQNWTHTAGFAYHMPESMSLFGSISLGFYEGISNKSTTIDKSRTDTPDYDTEITKDIKGDKTVNLAIRPAIRLPLEIWRMTQVEAGLNFDIDVYSPGSSNTTTEIRSGTNIYGNEIAKIETTSIEKDGEFTIGIFGKPTFEWNLLNDMISVIAEPKVSIDYTRASTAPSTMETTVVTTTAVGASSSVVTPASGAKVVENKITTELGANVGFEVNPKEWFSLRAGLRYNYIWDTLSTVRDFTLDGGTSNSEYDYAFKSELTPELGMAFDIEDTFIIDVVLTGTTGKDLTEIDTYDIQISCRF